MGPGTEFTDLDVLAVGPVVKASRALFDLFWRSASSVPISSLKREKISPARLSRQWAALAARCKELEKADYMKSARNSRLASQLQNQQVAWSWGEWRGYVRGRP